MHWEDDKAPRKREILNGNNGVVEQGFNVCVIGISRGRAQGSLAFYKVWHIFGEQDREGDSQIPDRPVL